MPGKHRAESTSVTPWRPTGQPWTPIVSESPFDRTWMEHAACVGKPSEWFFPEDGEWYEEARETCAGCPVRLRCLETAVAAGGAVSFGGYGMWGGLSPRERRSLRRGKMPRCGALYNGDRTHMRCQLGAGHDGGHVYYIEQEEAGE